jgi:hypothetical protein
MAMSPDPLAPAGITWEEAMNNAAEHLKSVGQAHRLASPDVKAALAQAWISYAREITMHTRAAQRG